MERYFAINTKHLWAPHEVNINSEELQYWILYQTCKEGGKSIRMQTSKGARYKLNQVIPGSLHCILFVEGEEYFFEHLEEEEAQLNDKESMQVYDKLEEYSWKYMIDGGDTFVEKIEGAESRVFYDNGFQKIKRMTPKDMFKYWISEKWERTLDKAKLCGFKED